MLKRFNNLFSCTFETFLINSTVRKFPIPSYLA